MRITYILLNAYAMGGTVRTVFNQAGALAERGHRVQIVSVMKHRTTTQFRLNPKVTLTPLVDKRLGVLEAERSVRNRIPWLRTAPTTPGVEVPQQETRSHVFTRVVENAVIRALRDCTADVLVSTRPALNLLAARYAPASVLRIGQVHQRLKRKHQVLRRAIVADYPRLDAVVTLTDGDRARYARILDHRVRVVRVPNPVATLDAAPADPAAKVVVAAGRLVRAKGFDILIPAFARVVAKDPQWRLRIFGTGPLKAELTALIDHHGLNENVRLMGRTRTLDEELAKASMFALSSRSEGLPMVILEAFTHGLPVVSCAYPGAEEIVADGRDGVVVPMDDIDELGNALAWLATDLETRTEMGARARAKSRDYGPDAIGAVWEELFDRLRETAPTTAR